jgi:hypothetical protein
MFNPMINAKAFKLSDKSKLFLSTPGLTAADAARYGNSTKALWIN